MNVLEWTQDKLETLEYIANTWIHDMGNVLDIHFPSENSIDKKVSLYNYQNNMLLNYTNFFF
jgi:hypothetical protein